MCCWRPLAVEPELGVRVHIWGLGCKIGEVPHNLRFMGSKLLQAMALGMKMMSQNYDSNGVAVVPLRSFSVSGSWRGEMPLDECTRQCHLSARAGDLSQGPGGRHRLL